MRQVLWLVLWGLWGFGLNLPAVLASPSPHAPPQLAAATPPPALFAFAHSLYAAGEYHRAIGEFQRFLFFQADHPLASEALLTIGMAFFCGERWLPAFEVFRRLTRATPDAALRAEAALWMAETRARTGDQGDQEEAIRLYRELIRQFPGSTVADRAAYLLGWSYVQLRRWADAFEAFWQVDPKSRYRQSAERLAAMLQPPPDLPQRSPTVAQILSTVLPGAGQIYTGHMLDGLIGLGLHGAMIAGVTGAAMAGLEGATGIGAFFTWGFYRSQMSNAAALARAFNVQEEERFIGQLSAQEGSFLYASTRPLPCMPSPPRPSLRP